MLSRFSTDHVNAFGLFISKGHATDGGLGFLLDFGLYSLYNGGMEKLNPSKGNPETK